MRGRGIKQTMYDNNFEIHGAIEDSNPQQITKRIVFFIVSDDYYFKLGAVHYITNFYASFLKKNHHCEILIKTYSINQTPSVRDDVILNKSNDSNYSVVIVDKNFIHSISFIISHVHLGYAFFVASDDLIKMNFEKLIMSESYHSGKVNKLPCFILFGALNKREKRICHYFYRGYTPKLIGLILGINPKTVSGYKSQIMKKTGCLNKVDFNKAIIDYYRFCTLE